MYVRASYYQRKRRRRRKILLYSCIAAAILGIGGISLVLAETVLAAPENLETERAVEALLEAQSTVSANIIIEEEAKKKSGSPVVVLDAGHGGIDTGCAAGGILEKDINLEIAKLVEVRLTDMGYEVLMARPDDSYIAKEQRAEEANAYEADIYVSIHQNSCEDEGVKGIETYYYEKDNGESRRLARLVQQETLKGTEAVERTIRNDEEFCVLARTDMPACLIETGFLTNAEERNLLSAEEYREKIAEGIARGIELYFHPKTMYLTFDDGPRAEYTDAVLDILKKRNIKATFFVVGENVRKNPETARRIAAEGHTIGIHCNNHAYDALYQSADSYMEDFEEAYNTVREITGVEARLFRFPGGSINAYNDSVRDEIIERMTEKGFVYFDWNASLEDAVKEAEPEQLIANAKESTLGRKKVVMLAHDVVYPTTLCLDELLGQFPDYRMEALTDDIEPIQFGH